MSAKILIVDDEPTQLVLIGYALKAEGYEIVTAESGEEALDKVQTEHPDLVILDIMLPGKSGIEVCQELRTRPEMIDLPIIMLTVRKEVPDKIMGLEAGADEYVTKPVAVDEMVARVRALLDRTDRLRKVQRVEYGKVLGFIGAKGGVGTTTVAVNVALALVKHGKTVIAVELRSYFGSFALHLGLTPAWTLSDLSQQEPERIDEAELSMRLTNHPTGLRVLLGPQRADEYRELSPDLVKAVVKGLARMADYTVIDLPPYPSVASRAALRRCDSVVVVVEPEPACVTSGKVTLELLESWGVPREIVRTAIVNHTGLGESMRSSEIRSRLGCKIAGIITPAPELSTWALRMGRPLILSEPDSEAAESLVDMACRLAVGKAIAVSA
ncbi:MAG: response regulator [Anaerolineae bacterium]